LAIEPIHDGDWARLNWLGKLRSMAHGRKSAYPVAIDLCRGCGRCVDVCPEHAITLVSLPRA
jgi:ferredoxin